MSLFEVKVILYLKGSTDFNRKLLEIIHVFSKVTGYKISILASVAFLYINDKHTEKELKETKPFVITQTSDTITTAKQNQNPWDKPK